MLNEFKKFIFKGNVVDLSTGVLIGAAFGGIVKAFTDGVVTPLLSLAGGGKPDFKLQLWIFDLGMIINAVIAFLITAAIVFFLIVKPMNKALAIMNKEEPAAPAAPPADIALLTEIRDLLKK
jgi:large conductance mechanosensitive channel